MRRFSPSWALWSFSDVQQAGAPSAPAAPGLELLELLEVKEEDGCQADEEDDGKREEDEGDRVGGSFLHTPAPHPVLAKVWSPL